MKKKELEIKLQALTGFENPSAILEQYSTPARIAADILFTALAHDDIVGKKVVDLGCGTGIFAIGAGLLSADSVTGYDVDPKAIETARRNAGAAGVEINFQVKDIEKVTGSFYTALQNPPFGAQTKHADRPFLRKATKLADVVYTIHNSDTEKFIQKKAGQHGFSVSLMKRYKFEMKHTFQHHRKDRMDIDVTLFRIVGGSDSNE